MIKISKLLRTQLFRITSLNSLSILVKILVGLVNSKLIAIYAGPSGMGLLGNMRNFMAFVESLGTLGFQNGIIKYIAENQDDKSQLSKIISTVFVLLLIVVVFLSVTIWFASSSINQFLFGSENNFEFVIKLLGLALPWYIFSLVLIAIINGVHQYKNVIIINIIGNLIGLGLSIYLIVNYKTIGALSGVILAPSILFLASWYFVNKEIKIREYISIQFLDISIVKKMSPYSLMFLVSAIVGPLVYLEIRNNIILTIGGDEAGYWEAMSRVSTYALMFVSTLLSVYYYPRLAVTKSRIETRNIFLSFYKWILSSFGVVLVVIYLFREFIVSLLFTTEFTPVLELFKWQLLGDLFKAASMILGYQFLAKKMTKSFIITEVLSLSVLFFSSNYLMQFYNVEGVVMGYALSYFVYFVMLLMMFSKTLFSSKL